jgi:hypothetical protein
MSTPSSTFPLTFTAGGLFDHESRIVAERLLAGQSWDDIRQAVYAENLLQVTRQSSITRLYSELHRRMLTLNPRQSWLLVHGQPSEQQAVLWLAACRHYPFVAAFARLLHERYQAMQYTIDYGEYAYFYAQLAEQHPRLQTLTAHTQRKMRSVIYKMAREAGLLTPHHEISGVFVSQALVDTLSHHDEMLFFPGAM